jgi:hypothetical protein
MGGVSLYCLDQVRDQVTSALELNLNLGKAFVDSNI